MQIPKILHTILGGVHGLSKAHPWTLDCYTEEELLIIVSIKISMSNTRCIFKIKSHAINEDEHINSLS